MNNVSNKHFRRKKEIRSNKVLIFITKLIKSTKSIIIHNLKNQDKKRKGKEHLMQTQPTKRTSHQKQKDNQKEDF